MSSTMGLGRWIGYWLERPRRLILAALREDNTIGGISGLALRRQVKLSADAVYATLLNLEEEGLVRRTIGVPERRRGGLPAHFFRITAAGRDWKSTFDA